MLKLTKYLKPFVGMIIAAVILLFVQAMCDLALPDYMSNIVNKGIQQGGIVNAVPGAIRQSQMDRLILFMSPDDKLEVAKNYTLIDKSSPDYNKYVKDYPSLAKEPVYILNNIDKSEIDKINPVMGRAFLAVSGIEKVKAEAKDGVISFNGMEFPADTDPFSIIAKLSPEQVSQITEAIDKKFTALGDGMVNQAAVSLVKAEYAALGMNTDKIQSGYITRTGMFMLLISLLGAACTIAVGFIAARTAAGLSRKLRKNVFAKVESFSNAEFDKFSTASLITRTTNDITQVQMFVIIMIRMVFYAPIMGVGGVIRAVSKSTSMSWIIAVSVSVLLGLVLIVFKIAMPRFKTIQKLVDKLNLVTRENLSGMMVIRAFNNQAFEEKRFDEANQTLTSTNLFINRVMASMFPVMMLIMNGVTLLIVWIGAHQIASSSMQVGDMMAFMQYAMQIIMAFLMMSMMFIILPRASVSAHRIAEVLETEPTIIDPDNARQFDKSMSGVVEFRNVYFRYPGAEEDVLKDISFKAMPGQTTAIIGSTGAGKTTLINLIPRFYDVTAGQLLVGGNVHKLPQLSYSCNYSINITLWCNAFFFSSSLNFQAVFIGSCKEHYIIAPKSLVPCHCIRCHSGIRVAYMQPVTRIIYRSSDVKRFPIH
jgi:ATP-binding cassette subfamily B multidrug efflux pump